MNENLLGSQIAKFRKAAGLTQEELGRSVGVSTQAVSRWECGGTPDVTLLPAIDGKELSTIAPDSLYDLMSLIGQSVFLFDDTILRNITMFRDFPEERVQSAVQRAGLTTLLAQTYYGHLRRALQTCIKGICTQFDQLGHAHPPAP